MSRRGFSDMTMAVKVFLETGQMTKSQAAPITENQSSVGPREVKGSQVFILYVKKEVPEIETTTGNCGTYNRH